METKQTRGGRRVLSCTVSCILMVSLEIAWIVVQGVVIIIHRTYKRLFPGDGKDLRGKIVLVTGAGNGLGKELSLLFAKQGSKVICVDIRKEDNDRTVDKIKYETGDKEGSRGYICDVSETSSVERLRDTVLQDWGKVDILVNNAGIVYANSFLSGNEDCIKRVTRAFLPQMKARNEGQIVFINSLSSLCAIAKGCIYSASKSGLLGLTMALDEELRQERSNIKITSAHPYFISTNQAYTESFDTRLAPITTSEAAQDILTGIRREYFTFQVPGGELGYGLCGVISLFPTKIYHLVKGLISADFILPPKDDEYLNIPGKADEDCQSYSKLYEKFLEKPKTDYIA